MKKSFLHRLICFKIILFYCFTGTSQNVNFVRIWTPQRPLSNDYMVANLTSVQEVTQNTQYLDGLGRLLQTVTKGLTSLGKDVVMPVLYDELGREEFKYLPYVSTANNGNYRTSPLTEQNTFYSNASSPISGQGETYYYSKTIFEASPLNRVQKTLPPGNSWVGADRGVEIKYLVNTQTDAVRIWNVTNNAGVFGSYSSNATYGQGQLYKIITTDENNKQVIEFKDKEGQIILKKVQLTSTDNSTTGSSHDNWLCTYYIYDDLNNLRCVIQPEGVEAIKSNWMLTNATILAEQCFRYEYDGRNRMTMKKVPGGGIVNMIYDTRDRLIMTQDANLKTVNKWMVTVYDISNHPVKTGLLTDANTPTHHQTQANLANPNASTYPPVSGSNFELLTETYYDDYTWFLSSGSPFSGNLDATQSATGFLTPTNTAFPYPQAKPENQQKSNIGLVTGTKIKVIASTPAKYLYTVIYYDNKERIIQTKSTNITGDMDISTNQYTFDGKLLVNKLAHRKSGSNQPLSTIITTNTYDAAGRLLTIKKKVNDAATVTIVAYTYDELGQLKTKKLSPAYNNNNGLATLAFDYNIRGWLLGMNRTDVLTTNTPSVRKIGYELGYDKLTTTAGRSFTTLPQYNGNITGVVWKSSGDGVRRKYDYSYDNANRLLKAEFEQNNPGTSSWNPDQVNYKVIMGDGTAVSSAYDNNGNIKRMQQWGLKPQGSSQIDDLTYTYTPYTNKLQNIADAFNDPSTKLSDFRISPLNPEQTKISSTVDYSYDANGNMIKDRNKDIGVNSENGITYNYMNLPQNIIVGTAAAGQEAPLAKVKGTITYVYDAMGNKLQKITKELVYSGDLPNGSITTTTSYINGFVYESKDIYTAEDPNGVQGDYTDILQFVGHEEGRIRYKPADNTTNPAVPASFTYDYFIKDHLGNVRMMLTEERQIDVYPRAGMETANAATEKLFYSQIDETRSPKPSGYPADNIETPNTQAAKLNGSGNKIGPGTLLKVMAGDTFNIFANSWYKKNGVTPGSPVNPLNAILDILEAGVSNASSGKASVAQLSSSDVLSPAVTSFLGTQSVASGKPKAYLNWVFFDEQFKYVSTGSGFQQVGDELALTPHVKDNLTAYKNGYLYIYVSNVTPNIDVFFDNLKVTHIRGKILEENHYYPFGLIMTGISSKAANVLSNKNKYQTYEQITDFDLNLNESFYRTHDPQLGRFWQSDPKAADEITVYAAMDNNPISKTDYLGDRTRMYSDDGSYFGDINTKNGDYATILNGDNAWAAALVMTLINEFNITSEKLLGLMENSIRGIGENYDLASFEKFADGNNSKIQTFLGHDVNDVSNVSIEDMGTHEKSSLKSKHAELYGNIVLDGNVLKVGDAKNFRTWNDFNSGFPGELSDENNKKSYIHDHPITNAGTEIYFNYIIRNQSGSIIGNERKRGFAGGGPSPSDLGFSGQFKYRSVVVDKKNIYLTQGDKKVITIERKN